MKNDVTFLYDLSWGYMAACVMQTANELDVFTHLSEGPMSAGQVSERCKTKPDITDNLLTACTAMGLIEKNEGTHSNSKLSETYLVRGAPLYQGDIIAHQSALRGFWNSLADNMKQGAVREGMRQAGHRDFIMGMHNVAVSGRGQMFLDTVDLSGRKKLFDVGGGPGTYSILACRQYPQLSATVFDLPETIAIAREMIAAEGMTERVEVATGNWDNDDFGHGNDVVLFSDVMHGPGSNAPMKLKKAHDSMVDGGLLVIQEFLLNDERTGPLIPAIFSIMVGAFAQGELLSIVEQAGFCDAAVVSNCERIGSAWITATKG